MTEHRIILVLHVIDIVLTVFVALWLVHVSRNNAVGVRDRLERAAYRAQANLEVEAEDLKEKVEAAEATVRETAEVTNSKIDTLSDEVKTSSGG